MRADGPAPVGVDRLLRWCAESLVAIGFSMEHALLLGSIVSRQAQVQSPDRPLAAFLRDMHSMLAGALQVVPEYQAQRVSDTALCLTDVEGHEVFAIHAALEFAVHAAILHGWGAADIRGLRSADALLAFAPQIVQQGLSLVAVRADGSAHGDPASTVTFGSASPDIGHPLVDVPARLLAPDATQPLAAALLDIGICADVPENFDRHCTSGLQVWVVDPEQCPREAALIQLRGADAASLPGARPLAWPLPAQILPSAVARTQISRWSRQLQVFDPFETDWAGSPLSHSAQKVPG